MGDREELSGLAERSEPALSDLLTYLVKKEAPARTDQREKFASDIEEMLGGLMRDVARDGGSNISDVAAGLADISLQLFYISRGDAACPVVQLGDGWIPLLLRGEARQTDRLSAILVCRSGVTMPLPFALASPERATQLMVNPLSRFLALRWLWGGSTSGNVEVHNTASGWDILYSPPHAYIHNGFGGPSTRVTGHLGPGNYHFAITNGSTTTWDSTTWAIPPTLSAPTPHKVHIPLP